MVICYYEDIACSSVVARVAFFFWMIGIFSISQFVQLDDAQFGLETIQVKEHSDVQKILARYREFLPC